MLCYMDRTFCNAPCATIQCPFNIKGVDRKHVAAVGLPIAQSDRSANCSSFKRDEE